MNRVVVGVGLFLALVTGCGGCAGADRGSRYIDRATEVAYLSAVKVRVACSTLDGVRAAVGSGTTISSRHVVTAWHVVSCGRAGIPEYIEVETASGHVVEMAVDDTVLEADAVRLVVVGVAEPFSAWATYYHDPPRVGDLICIVTAFPERTRKCGEVWPPKDGMLRFDIEVFPGNSGSGIYDADGRLVGMVTMFEVCVGQVCGGRGWASASWSELLQFPPSPSWFELDTRSSQNPFGW